MSDELTMKIKGAIIIMGDDPISMSKDELENFQGNIVLSKSSIPKHILDELIERWMKKNVHD